MQPEPAMVRIGELSRRLGVSAHVLRAWERRYQVLSPVRSQGGYRLYSPADEQRIRVMQAHLAGGLSAAEAAQAALRETPRLVPPVALDLSAASEALARAMDGFDEPSAQAVLDRLLTEFTPETVLRDVLMPYLGELGERWDHGEATVAQEHFASNVIRSRLAALGRGWGQGQGPRALLACAPGELHDIPLLAFGVVLYRNGWRVSFLGAATPMADLLHTATTAPPRIIAVSAVDPARFAGLEPELRELASVAPLVLGGRGATEETAHASDARLLPGDLVTEAERLSSTAP
jgi:DNA-binding transcriptional MerR regulator